MKPIKIYTGITNGKPQDKEGLENAFKYFEGLGVDITIERHKTRRTNPQNKYWWGCVLPLIVNYLEETEGLVYSSEEIHEYYIQKGYFGYKKILIHGEETEIPKRSSESTTLEFSNAKERLQLEWAERNLIIPDPNQKDFLED